MPRFNPLQEVYWKNDVSVEGVVLYSILNVGVTYYCVYTNEGEKRFFSEDEIVPLKDKNTFSKDTEISNDDKSNWMACSFLEFLFGQIPEEECFLAFVDGSDRDYWWLHLQWDEEQTVNMKIKCSFCDDKFFFHEIEADWSLELEPFTSIEGELSIDLGEDEEQEDYQQIICKSVRRFLEEFSEYEGICLLIDMYNQIDIIDILAQMTVESELIWEHKTFPNGTEGYESTDDIFTYRLIDNGNGSYLNILYQIYSIAVFKDDDSLLSYSISTAKNDSSVDNDMSYIGTRDIVVRTGYNRCIFKEHNLEMVNAVVNMIDFKRQLTWEETVQVLYCKSCNCYYMLNADFQRLKRKGYFGCQVITREDQEKRLKTGGTTWAAQSDLKLYGYSVNKKDGLTQKERQDILSFIIENNILSIPRICEYLNWFIKINRRIPNKESAISKWEDDIDFVKNYRVGSKKIKIGTIYKKD